MKNRTAATRGRSNRAKGANAERELAALLNGATIRGRTLTARRVPNVGAMAGGGWGGDVLMGERCRACPHGEIDGACVHCQGTNVEPGSEERIEVKRRATGGGFKLLERWIKDSYALAIRTDRVVWPDGRVIQEGEWLVVIRLKDLVEMKEPAA